MELAESVRRNEFQPRFHQVLAPGVFFAGFIFWMSTETFSSENTFSIVEAVIHFVIRGLSAETIDLIHVIIRKLAHVVEYLILGFLLFRAFRGHSSAWWSWRWFFLASIVVLLWAASDEFHQSFVPTRTASVVDVGIDSGWISWPVCKCLMESS